MKKLAKLVLGGLFGIFTFALVAPTVNVAEAQFGLDTTYTQGMVPGSGEDKADSLIDVIKLAINRVLGILGLIVLILLLWGGFQMVTAAGDETKYKEGFKILKQAAIGLAFIAISWFMVSIIFWLLGKFTGEATPTAMNNNNYTIEALA